MSGRIYANSFWVIVTERIYRSQDIVIPGFGGIETERNVARMFAYFHLHSGVGLMIFGLGLNVCAFFRNCNVLNVFDLV